MDSSDKEQTVGDGGGSGMDVDGTSDEIRIMCANGCGKSWKRNCQAIHDERGLCPMKNNWRGK